MLTFLGKVLVVGYKGINVGSSPSLPRFLLKRSNMFEDMYEPKLSKKAIKKLKK